MCFKKKIIPNKEIYDVEKKIKSFYNGWKAFALSTGRSGTKYCKKGG